MMLKILLHRLFRDVARTPRTVADGPEVSSPVLLAQGRIFFLKSATCASLHPLDQIRERLRRRIFDVHVDMVFTHYAFENPHVLGVADLHEQVPAPHLDVSDKHVVAILRDPDDVRRQPRRSVPAVPVLFHGRDFYHAAKVWSN